jgi:hypothetical protein
MLRKLRPRSAYDVMAALALFFALGGSAYAAFVVSSNSQIGPDTIYGANKPGGANDNVVNGSLTGADIQDYTVGKDDIQANSVNAARVIDNSLTASDLGSNSVSTSEIKDGSVTNAKLAPGATKVIVRRSSIGATATGGGNIVDCQGAEHVMGGGVGGFGQDGGQPIVVASQPDNGDTTTPPTAWAGEIANRAGAGTVGGTVSAICASP